MATCWNLISCNPGTYPDISGYTETDLTIYEGQYIYINGEEDETYQVIPVEEEDCNPDEVIPNITSIVIVPSCIQNCDCPEDFEYDPELDLCVGIYSIPATQNPENLTVEAAGNVSSYGNAGGAFYPLLDGLSLPIQRYGTVPALFEDDGTPYNLDPTIVPNPIFPVWSQRLNIAGIWNSSIPTAEWTGFTACVNIAATRIYTIGIASDNRCRFRINGQEIFTTENVSTNNTWNFRFWHLFPITLNAGQNIIEMEGYNEGAQAAFAAEIYEADTLELSAISTEADLEEVIVFSTIDKIGDIFDLGTTIGYSCPDGYSLSNCSGEVSCVLRLEAPYTPCCVQLEDCSGVLDDLFVRETFDVIVNTVIRLQEYPQTCWLVVNKKLPCTEDSIEVTVTETFGTCETCSQSFFSDQSCEIIPEPVEPNFESRYCSPDKTIEIHCDYANGIYKQYLQMKHGITTCCEYNYDKAEIKYEILRLQEMYDPELCVETIAEIPNPCTPEPEPIVCPTDISTPCPAPTGVSATIEYLT